ncbi:hypothetical protein [Jonquetella sp. BV3C21]|uniref:hypothetical protein n=1 Tax=Jonquetella sp. BV3C21 TaxID=1111126 RepID=UPI0003ADB360|nr:hypothetical protein [Jonquetella sp. BV3C21]ERL24054.1 hypothetical protein HMPREF1249_1134 [Jonquetella sp. BV3C21]
MAGEMACCEGMAFGVFYGASIGKGMPVVRKEAFDKNDELMLLLFGDALGVPNPLAYYMLEALPYVYESLPSWERRMQNRKNLLAEKAAQYGFDG